jgi:chemotaxis protein histidine kinase CheA
MSSTQANATAAAAPTQQQQQTKGPEIKDMSEVGWLFIQQYYSHVNNQPNILHRFYTTNSTLCHGVEGFEVPSYKGQTQIQQRIKEHNFQDCKVLVSNVDVQSSADGGVVVQVLGEMANNGGPSQKFAQTFFLAPQPRGYYVLNDILRFLKEDVEDYEEQYKEDEKPAASVQQSEAASSESSLFSQKIDNTNKEQQQQPQPVNGAVNGAVEKQQPDQSESQQQTAEKKPQPQPQSEPELQEQPQEQPQQKQTQQPKKPEQPAATVTPEYAQEKQEQPAKKENVEQRQHQQTEATETQQQQQQQKQQPSPAVPLTWADKISMNAPPKSSGNVESGNSPVAAGAAPTPAAATKPAVTKATTAAAQQPKKQQQNGNGHGNKKPEYHSVYLKQVTDKVNDKLLRQQLEKIGKVTHFQVEKAKQCAFVDFIDEATLKAALAVHELKVGDQIVLIEERKRGLKNKNKNRNANSKRHHNNNTNKA